MGKSNRLHSMNDIRWQLLFTTHPYSGSPAMICRLIWAKSRSVNSERICGSYAKDSVGRFDLQLKVGDKFGVEVEPPYQL
jgi:hypothetical protein